MYIHKDRGRSLWRVRQEVVREASQPAETSDHAPDPSGGPGVCSGLRSGVADDDGRERALAHVCAYPTAPRKPRVRLSRTSVSQFEVLNVAKRLGDERVSGRHLRRKCRLADLHRDDAAGVLA